MNLASYSINLTWNETITLSPHYFGETEPKSDTHFQESNYLRPISIKLHFHAIIDNARENKVNKSIRI